MMGFFDPNVFETLIQEWRRLSEQKITRYPLQCHLEVYSLKKMSLIGFIGDLKIRYLRWSPSLINEHFQNLAALNLTEGVNFSKFSIVQKYFHSKGLSVKDKKWEVDREGW